MTWGPHDLRLAEILAEQRRQAARRAGISLKHRLRGRRAAEWGGVFGHLQRRQLHWPIHLHHAAHGAAGHH